MNEKVSLARIYYPVKVLGPGNRVGIWLNGCKKNCPGCITPEMQYYDPSKEVTIDEIIQMVLSIKKPIDGFTISGGEPFYSPEALNILVSTLSTICDDILIFTGYTLTELKKQKNKYINAVLKKCSAIVDGPFVRELSSECKGLRGSANQHCWVFKHQDRYAEIEIEERKLQNIVFERGMLTIGIP